MNRLRLPTIVFLCGAVVMAYELVGSRVLAPFVGSSLFVWTSLIGIILASLSAGYWYGGRLADRWPRPDVLAHVIWAAAVGITATALLHTPLLMALSSFTLDQRVTATIAALLLFAPASCALGMVSPFAARLAMRDVGSSGSTVGMLYAASTAGSIAGTFLTGWVLIGFFGTTTVLYILAGLTMGASFMSHASTRVGARVATGLVIIMLLLLGITWARLLAAQGIVDIDTRYQRAQILTGTSAADRRPVRYLRTDPLGAQSAVYLDGDGIVASYVRAFRDITASGPAPSRVLVIGGGAQVWPMHFMADYPTATMDVVEIDPGLIGIARRYFGFIPREGLRVIHEDGRTFLNRSHLKYDIVFLDAFTGTTIPVQLTTREAVLGLRTALEPGGVVVTNTIGAVDGDRARLTQAMVATYRSVFPFVTVVPLLERERSTEPQNVLLIASDHAFVLPAALQSLARTDIDTDRVPVLTDEFAPVERLAASML